MILAVDGSSVYDSIPGALPSTEAGLVSLGVVVIRMADLSSLPRLPISGAVNPRDLRSSESGETLAVMLPGQNAAHRNGESPKNWFRRIVDDQLLSANLGGESFAETLWALLGDGRTVTCPDNNCGMADVAIPEPGNRGVCSQCNGPIYMADVLRIHELFRENEPAGDCHGRFRHALEIIALVNALRILADSEKGRIVMKDMAFVLDGPLAAFSSIAVLANAVRSELTRIQSLVDEGPNPKPLVVITGLKSGAFVQHAAEIDRGPEPGKNIPNGRYWMPGDRYIRKNIVASTSRNPKPWGEVTYFGRPLILKTHSGKRLVLNIAQPEAEPPLTERPPPLALADAIATADPLGIGADQFLPLRRVHAQAAIPLKLGTDLIKSLAS